MKRSPIKRRAPMRKKGEGHDAAVMRDARDAAFERDNYECQGRARGLDHECSGRLHAHHILRRSQGGRDHPANLVCLCDHAHLIVHTRTALAYELGLLQRSGDFECAGCGHVARLHASGGQCTYGPHSYGMECPCQSFVEDAA